MEYTCIGFPRHHRVLHVKQEVRSSEKSVLECVLQSDVEREALLEEEKEIVARQQVKEEARDTAGKHPLMRIPIVLSILTPCFLSCLPWLAYQQQQQQKYKKIQNA